MFGPSFFAKGTAELQTFVVRLRQKASGSLDFLTLTRPSRNSRREFNCAGFRNAKTARCVCSDNASDRPRIDTVYRATFGDVPCTRRQLRSIASAAMVCHNSESLDLWPLVICWYLKPRNRARSHAKQRGRSRFLRSNAFLEKTGLLIITCSHVSVKTASSYTHAFRKIDV